MKCERSFAMSRIVCALVLAVTVLAPTALGQPVRDRTLRLDVIELLKGERIEGKEEFAAQHGKFTYLFADDGNMMTFLMNPEKYEIQLGGACARMGALSGEGSVRLPAAHDGKVYLFASEACRARFLDSPEAFLAVPEAAPETTQESRALGRRMLGRAVDAVMCHAMIDGVKTYREVLVRDEKHGETNYHVTSALTLRRADSVHWKVCWNESCWAYVAHQASGWMISGDGVQDMNGQQRDELWREAGRHPYTLLWARDSKDIIASADGTKRTITIPEEGEIEVELVTVHLRGATSTLGLDETGRIRLQAYRGRGPNSTIGDVEKIYSKFHVVNELRVPGRVDVSFNGEAAPNESGVFVEQVFDDPADDARFNRTKTAAASAVP
jgi:YHS domain-containing protein